MLSVVSVDLMEFHRVRPLPFTIAFSLGLLTLITAFIEENVKPYQWSDGGQSFASQGSLRTLALITTFYILFYFFLFAYKLHIRSHQKFKKVTLYPMAGILIYGPFLFSAFLLGATLSIPGIHAIFIGIGAFISAMTLARHPEILYLLPFNVISLNIVSFGSGLVPYRYVWNNEQDIPFEPTLFGAFFETNRQFSTSTLPLGSIVEIKLEKASLITKPMSKLDAYVVMIADRFSETLYANLVRFSKELENMDLGKMRSNIKWEVKQINELVVKHFPYIPNYA